MLSLTWILGKSDNEILFKLFGIAMISICKRKKGQPDTVVPVVGKIIKAASLLLCYTKSWLLLTVK